MFLEMKREARAEVDQRKSGPKEAGKEEDSKEGKKAHAFLQIKYSETRLLRTLKGNEKRYVLTKVRSIQNVIFLTGRTSSTCARDNLPRKVLQVRPECRSLLAFHTVKSPFRAS